VKKKECASVSKEPEKLHRDAPFVATLIGEIEEGKGFCV